MFKLKRKENFFIKNKDNFIIIGSFLFMICTMYFANIGTQKSIENIKVNSEIYKEDFKIEEIKLNYYAVNLETNKIEEIGYKVPLSDYKINSNYIFAKEYINLNLNNKIVSPFPENLKLENINLENGKLTINLRKDNKIKENRNFKISDEKRMDAIYKTFMNIKEVEEVVFKINGKVSENIIAAK